MRNIGITTFVTLLMLGTAIIGSGHIVLARDFSNSGNYLVNDQNCTAGTCTQTSSNTVTSGSSGLTSPPVSISTFPVEVLTSVQPDRLNYTSVQCPSGSVVTGGGFNILSHQAQVLLNGQHSNGWSTSVFNNSGSPILIAVIATCAESTT